MGLNSGFKGLIFKLMNTGGKLRKCPCKKNPDKMSHNLHQNGAEFHFAQHVIITARCLIVNDVVNCVNSILNVQLNQI